MALETTIEQATGRVPVTIIALDGELDASNFNELIETARGLYDSGTRHLLIDMANLRFMASSGLVALHSILRLMHGETPPDPEAGWGALHSLGLDVSGGDDPDRGPAVRAAGPAVERVLTRTGLSRLFHVHPDRASAHRGVLTGTRCPIAGQPVARASTRSSRRSTASRRRSPSSSRMRRATG